MAHRHIPARVDRKEPLHFNKTTFLRLPDPPYTIERSTRRAVFIAGASSELYDDWEKHTGGREEGTAVVRWIMACLQRGSRRAASLYFAWQGCDIATRMVMYSYAAEIIEEGTIYGRFFGGGISAWLVKHRTADDDDRFDR